MPKNPELLFAIGKPGERVRLFLECKSEALAQVQLKEDEVYVQVPSKGDFQITEDGKSCFLREKSPGELAQEAEREFIQRRKAAYPDIGDQLDALWKGLANLPNPSPHWKEILETIEAVKAENPKP